MPGAICANDFCARLAGPAFEIVQPSFYVLPHSQAAWLILTERLQDLARRAERLSATAGLAQLTELATDLDGMDRDLQSPARGRTASQSRRMHHLTAGGPLLSVCLRWCAGPVTRSWSSFVRLVDCPVALATRCRWGF